MNSIFIIFLKICENSLKLIWIFILIWNLNLKIKLVTWMTFQRCEKWLSGQLRRGAGNSTLELRWIRNLMRRTSFGSSPLWAAKEGKLLAEFTWKSLQIYFSVFKNQTDFSNFSLNSKDLTKLWFKITRLILNGFQPIFYHLIAHWML